MASGDGHAEANIVAYMQQNGITPLQMGAGQLICPDCANAIQQAGCDFGSPLKIVTARTGGGGPAPTITARLGGPSE